MKITFEEQIPRKHHASFTSEESPPLKEGVPAWQISFAAVQMANKHYIVNQQVCREMDGPFGYTSFHM